MRKITVFNSEKVFSDHHRLLTLKGDLYQKTSSAIRKLIPTSLQRTPTMNNIASEHSYEITEITDIRKSFIIEKYISATTDYYVSLSEPQNSELH